MADGLRSNGFDRKLGSRESLFVASVSPSSDKASQCFAAPTLKPRTDRGFANSQIDGNCIREFADVKSHDTTPELIVRRLVHSLGYRYRLHVRSLPGSPDIVFPRHGRIIFVNGCYWHGHSCGRCRVPATRRAYWLAKIARNAERDRWVQRQLRRLGWRVLVVWECQVSIARTDRLRDRLLRFFA